MQGDEILGRVTDIPRLLDTDYLLVKTDSQLVDEGLPANFMIPYIPRYVIEADTEAGRVLTRDTREILEAS
jgi:16S rRNA processing protein RimM